MGTRYANRTEVRSNYSTEFKAKVAAAYLNGSRTQAEVAEAFGVNTSLVTKWARLVREALQDKRLRTD